MKNINTMSTALSVIMLTYKHEDYLSDAINGVLMQDCDFEIELIIADDCSPDNTSKIVESFKSHPNFGWIKYTKHELNKGANENFMWAFAQATGKYIALCEGDDYWTDPLKLQKQVDFLEANDRYGLVYTNYRKLIVKEHFENDKNFRSYQNLDEYFRDGCPFLFTGSWLMKNEIGNLLLVDNKNGTLPGDVQILCHVLDSKYQVHYHNETTGVYRILEESASHSLVNNKDKDFALVKYLLLMKHKNHISKITFTEQLEQLIQNKFQYFESFRLGLIGRIGLFVKVAKIKGVNRASRFVIYNVS
jgi:glycosyltransferase involved in cell wall biosynthesis